MANLLKNEHCTGCTACASVCSKGCISMVPDKDGFLCPVIDSVMCVNCGRCEAVCPVMNPVIIDHSASKAYAAYTKDDAVRLSSSSGGIFTELSKTVLKHGGVVFGSAFGDGFLLQHKAVHDLGELEALRGSKYAQSDLGSSFKEAERYLKAGKTVLFSGTPCQISGLRSFLKSDYENLICVDLICHSAPSPKAWSAFLSEAASGTEADISTVNFRNKRNGWEDYSLVLSFTDGTEKVYNSKSNKYMQAFIGGLISRECCYNCNFKGSGHSGDITLGDFWGVQHIQPEAYNSTGTSVAIINSEKGRFYFEKCFDRITVFASDPEKALGGNPAYYTSCKRHKRRKKFFSNVNALGFTKAVDKYLPLTKSELAVKMIKRIPGKIKRTVKKLFTSEQKN